MHGRLYVIGVCGFAVGIGFATYIATPLPVSGFIVLLGVLFALSFLCAKRALYLSIGILILAGGLGMGRVFFAPSALPDTFRPLIGTDVTLEGVIVADPDIRETSQRVTIKVSKDGVSTHVIAVAPLYPTLSYGEHVHIEGRMIEPEPFDTNGGRTFNYDKFLSKDGVFALIERASVEVTGPRSGILPSVLGFFSDLKNGFLASIAVALPEPDASLAGGLVAGGKQGLGEDLLNAFIRSGLVHIVVLSGYNVMIVADAVMRALSLFPRRIAASVAGVVIGIFVLAAGAGAASIRAGLMAGIALFARASYRTYDAIRALLLAGVLMLLWNPLVLMYDPGFQLSFIATLGLILGTPLVEKKLSFIRGDFLREIASSTIAAQIAVLPLLLYQNGLFSVVALPANLLVLPIVPLAMAASAFAGLVGFLIPPVAPVLGFPAYVLLSYIIGIVETASALPLAAFSVPQFPILITVLAYAGLLYLLWKKGVFTLPRDENERLGPAN